MGAHHVHMLFYEDIDEISIKHVPCEVPRAEALDGCGTFQLSLYSIFSIFEREQKTCMAFLHEANK